MGIKLPFGDSPFPCIPYVPYSFVLYRFPVGRELPFLLCSTMLASTAVFFRAFSQLHVCAQVPPPPSICAFCAIEKSHTTACTQSRQERRKKEAKIRRIFLPKSLFFPRQSLHTYLRRGDIFWDASEFDCRLFSVKWALLPSYSRKKSFSFFLSPFFPPSILEDEGKETGRAIRSG